MQHGNIVLAVVLGMGYGGLTEPERPKTAATGPAGQVIALPSAVAAAEPPCWRPAGQVFASLKYLTLSIAAQLRWGQEGKTERFVDASTSWAKMNTSTPHGLDMAMVL